MLFGFPWGIAPGNGLDEREVDFMFDGADSYGVYDLDGGGNKDSQPPIKFRSWLVGYGGLGLAWIVCFICQEVYNALF